MPAFSGVEGVKLFAVDVAFITTLGPPVLAIGSVGKSAALVATKIRQDVAPGTEDQANEGVVDCPGLPFVGLESAGADRFPMFTVNVTELKSLVMLLCVTSPLLSTLT